MPHRSDETIDALSNVENNLGLRDFFERDARAQPAPPDAEYLAGDELFVCQGTLARALTEAEVVEGE